MQSHQTGIHVKNALSTFVAVMALAMVPGHAQERSRADISALYSQLPWRYIGPEGNRVIAVAGVPGDPLIYYAGAASGGIWKTSDGGQEWVPVFDDQPVSAIGALAVAPSDPDVVWAGTGEAFIGWSTNISLGMGVYKSMDGGRTWAQMGLEKAGRIARLVVDPTNANVALACALGHAYGPQQERGVFRTTDGGRSWDRVLFVDENTGCSDIAMSPKNPRILLAGMWQVEVHAWGYDSGGPGSGLFLSQDGGTMWKRVTRGMPKQEVGVGRVGVAIASSNPNRMYALIETGDGIPWNGKATERGQIWRSEDGGETWRMINADWSAMERTHYYTRIAVAPDNENETYYPTGRFSKSIDGGLTLVPQTRWLDAPATDHHDIWIDPINANRMIVGSDQGVSITLTRGVPNSWYRVRLPIAQMYHVTVDNQIPYKVYGNREDGPGYIGTSNSRRSASAESPMIGGTGSSGDPRITRNYWHTISNGENGWATVDPVNPDVVWTTGSGAGSVGGMVQRYVESRRQWRTVEVWPDHVAGPPRDLKYRFNWIMPIAISPFDHNKVYVGSQHVHQTTDGGQSWQVISPDLTLNDKTRQGPSGGLTGDDSGAGYEAIVLLAESPRERGLIWAGTNDGQVQMTRDGGKTWTNLSKNLNTLPLWGWVGSIEPSRYDAATAYLTVDFHHANNRDPYVYKTNDYGKTWKAITNGIPHSMLSWAHCIKEDPVRRGLLYLGTENAMYVSFDDGENWQPLQMNLPHAPVYGIQVQERFHDLVIATYGRGFWILDDLTPLQQLTPQVIQEPVHLFPPLPAYRFRQITNDSVIREDEVAAGNDPPYGAGINYYLKTTAPVGTVTITILDQKGQVVRTLPGTNAVGINRIHWNLRYERSKDIRLRTSPQYAPDMRVGPEGWRPAPDGGRLSILAPPGSYTVKLTVGERPFTQPLTVIKDPYSEGTEAEIQAQVTTLFELRRDMDRAADIVNGIDVARSQIQGLTSVVQDQDVRKAADDLDQKVLAVEQSLVDLRLTGPPGHTWESRLARKLSYLASQLASADFKPTDQQLEVQRLLEERLASCQSQFDALRARDLLALNELLRQRNLPPITTGPQ
jgi:photosystem II stability/assembly factor-like uncharacterized protein